MPLNRNTIHRAVTAKLMFAACRAIALSRFALLWKPPAALTRCNYPRITQRKKALAGLRNVHSPKSSSLPSDALETACRPRELSWLFCRCASCGNRNKQQLCDSLRSTLRNTIRSSCQRRYAKSISGACKQTNSSFHFAIYFSHGKQLFDGEFQRKLWARAGQAEAYRHRI